MMMTGMTRELKWGLWKVDEIGGWRENVSADYDLLFWLKDVGMCMERGSRGEESKQKVSREV